MSKDPKSLLKAYLVYVSPTLEYATCTWSPSDVTSIRKLESVQRRFTKRLRGMKEFNYAERLTALHIDSLEYRSLIADLLMT